MTAAPAAGPIGTAAPRLFFASERHDIVNEQGRVACALGGSTDASDWSDAVQHMCM